MLSGIILAGGSARAVQGTKAMLLPLAGDTVIGMQIREMQKLCSEIIIVTNEPRGYLEHVPRSVRIITDYYPNRGPLGGLYSALTLCKFSDVWVTGEAMPFVSSKLAYFLWEHKNVFGYSAVLPLVQNRAYPLHGMYGQDCVRIVKDLLLAGAERNEGWGTLLQNLRLGTVDETILQREEIEPNFSMRIKSDTHYELALIVAKQTRGRAEAWPGPSAL